MASPDPLDSDGFKQLLELQCGILTRTQAVAHAISARMVHGHVRAHEEDGRLRDMRRDNAGTVTGDGTLRYGWADAQGSACEVAAQVARVLCDRGWRGARPAVVARPARYPP